MKIIDGLVRFFIAIKIILGTLVIGVVLGALITWLIGISILIGIILFGIAGLFWGFRINRQTRMDDAFMVHFNPRSRRQTYHTNNEGKRLDEQEVDD